MLNNHILMLASPTQDDPGYFDRWARLGNLYFVPDKKEFKNINILQVDHRVIVTDNLLSKFPNLRYLVSANTGHTHFKFSKKKYNYLKIISLKGEREFLNSVRSVSELVFAFMLMLSRPINATGKLLRGRILGIIGLGRIGTHVKETAEQGFGMKVMTFDIKDDFYTLQKLFEYSDFISIHLPESKWTKKFVSRKFIFSMKKDAVLINTARGSIIDETALREALEQNRISGAAIDVVSDAKVLNSDVPNLIISDHVGGSTTEDRIRTDKFIVEKLEKFLIMDSKISAQNKPLS